MANNEYTSLHNIRFSDRTINVLKTDNNYNDPVISSATWGGWVDKFEAGSTAFSLMGDIAAARGNGKVAAAAHLTAAVAKAAAELANRMQSEAKVREQAAADKRALDRAIKDAVDRGMRDHNDRMSRGDYRDPPSRERMSEIGRMA